MHTYNANTGGDLSQGSQKVRIGCCCGDEVFEHTVLGCCGVPKGLIINHLKILST